MCSRKTIASVLIVLGAACSGERPRAPADTAGALALAPVPQTAPTAELVGRLQARVRTRPDDPEAWTALAEGIIRHARRAQDPRDYVLAEDAVRKARLLAPEHPGALVIEGHLLAQEHRFGEAAALARRVLARDPSEGRALGLLGDCLLELGRYDEAEVALQAMVDLRPDARSYARAAWMRWLTGDPEGSLEIFGLAVDAAHGPDAEARAWIRVQLGTVLRDTGETIGARVVFDKALTDVPGYAPALFARGKLRLDLGDVAGALPDLEAAAQRTGHVEHRWALADALRLSGREPQAAEIERAIERSGATTDPRTTALWLASRRGPERSAQAVELARAESARRDDVTSADVLSWALYRAGRLEEATAASGRALRLGTRDPRMLFHAGMIAAGRGQLERARTLLGDCLAQSPSFDALDAPRARAELAKLGAPASRLSVIF